MDWKLDRLYPTLPIVLFCALALWQILAPPFVGLANNGDFPRVTGRFSLGPESGDWSDNQRFFVARYVRHPKFEWHSGMPTIETALVAPVAHAAHWLAGDFFDIRWLGIFHFTLLLAAYWMLLGALRQRSAAVRWVVSLFAVWVFTDVRYVSYLNSFYTDVAAMLGLCLAAACAARLTISPRTAYALAGFTLGMILVVGSKTQHVLIVACGALFLAYAWQRRRTRELALASIFLIFACAVSGAILRLYPPTYAAPAVFSLTFYRLLPDAPNKAATAAELGLAPADLAYTGMHAWSTGSPITNRQWLESFARRVTFGRIAAFYLRHPGLLVHYGLKDLREQAPLMRSTYLYNYQKTDPFPPSSFADRFDSWTSLRMAAFRRFPDHAILLYGVFLALAIAHWRRSSSLAGPALFFATMGGALSYASAVYPDCIETSRHLFVFHAMTDVLILSVAALVLSRFTEAVKPTGDLRSETGV